MRLRDWPGTGGPLVHVPDPVDETLSSVESLAALLAPRYRVLSVSPRGGAPYQVDATDLLSVLNVFGFRRPVLIGERLGCVAALVAAAWYPDRLAGLVLLDPERNAPAGEGIPIRALCECPPDLAALRGAIGCPVLETSAASAVRDVEAFVRATLP